MYMILLKYKFENDFVRTIKIMMWDTQTGC